MRFRLIEHETEDFIAQNPKFAIVELASEGLRDGSKSTTIVGRIRHADLDGGFVETAEIEYEENGKGFIKSFDKNLYVRTLESLRAKGVQILYKVTDSLEKTEGLINKNAMDNPTDSWAMNTFIVDSGEGEFRFPIDDNFRTVAWSYNAPTRADIDPLDMPSVAIPKIAEAHGLKKGTPEYVAFMNNVTYVVLGPRGFQLKDEDSSDDRHKHRIADALRFKNDNGYTGMRIDPVSDGDLMPRVQALVGPGKN